MKKTRILIGDDHRVVIEGIKNALQKEPVFEIVGEALDGRQVMSLAESLGPDIVILDISMPEMDGLETTAQLKKKARDTRIVIFTMHSETEFFLELLKTGISAYVLKQEPISNLILALKTVTAGGTYFGEWAPDLLSNHMRNLENSQTKSDNFGKLSRREQEVFRLLADGLPIKKIAAMLFISKKTVESHKYNIMEKLHAQNTTELTKIALRKRLIQL
ncbi:MAG: response regulator [Thermodesulfobacteriota bacterium]